MKKLMTILSLLMVTAFAEASVKGSVCTLVGKNEEYPKKLKLQPDGTNTSYSILVNGVKYTRFSSYDQYGVRYTNGKKGGKAVWFFTSHGVVRGKKNGVASFISTHDSNTNIAKYKCKLNQK